MEQKCTEREFLQLWEKHKSAKALAGILGVGERAIHKRRRNIENKYKRRLDAQSPIGNYYKHLSPTEHSAKRTFTVQDGVVLVFSDAHFWPNVRTTAFRALLHFIAQLQPKAVVCNGDAFDGASISRFPRIMFLDRGPGVQDEIKACKDRLGEIEDAAGDARLFWPLGNHDARFETRLAQNAAEYEGVQGFHLKDHFPKWAPCWSVWINDDTVIKHRFKGGIHATHNNTLWSGKTIVTGHLHSLKVTPFDDYNGTRWGVDTGTLAEPGGPQFQDYLETNPTNWRSGFIVLSFKDGKLLWPEVVRVVDHDHVDFRGHLIEVPK